MTITLRTNDIRKFKRTNDATIVYTEDKVYVCVKEQKIYMNKPITTLLLKGERYGKK